MDKLFLRLIAECPDQAAVLQLESITLQRLAPWNAYRSHATVPYWKFPDHYELSYSLGPNYLDLIAQEPTGWNSTQPEPDISIVWNRNDDRYFIHPAVIWAELGFLVVTPEESDHKHDH